MKTTISKLAIVLLSFLVAFPASAKRGKIAEGVVYSTKNALVRSVRKNKERQDEIKCIRIEIENQFSMSYLLSPVRYVCETNSPTGYVRVGGGNLCGIWKYFPEKRRSELAANWHTAAQSLHDKVLEHYATIKGEESYYTDRFTTFTNSYAHFIADVSSLPQRGTDEKCVAILMVDLWFKDMIAAGVDIIYRANLKADDKATNKDSLDIEMLVVVGILGLYGIYCIYWAIGKIRALVDKISAPKRFTQLTGKIDDYAIRNGLKKSAVERLGKEVYVRFQTNDENNLTIAQGAKPNKDGFYLCSWALKDPRDDDFYYICPPTDYQILFNPDTGETEMQRLNDSNSQ